MTQIFDRIRIIPRPDDFLDRNVGSVGEVFYDAQANTLRLFNGKQTGGTTVLTAFNMPEELYNSGVATVSLTTTVVSAQGSDVGNKYNIADGVSDTTYKPDLTFVVGYTYVFDQTDQTNVYYPNANGTTANPHPLNFSSDDPNGELGSGTTYTDGVVYKINNDPVTKQEYWDRFNAATQRSVQITIKSTTPSTLYYWCKNHLNMGATITKANPGSGSGGGTISVSATAPESPDAGTIWFNSTSGRLYVWVNDTDSNQWVQPSVPLGIPNAFSNITLNDSSQLSSSGSDTLNIVDGPGIEVSSDPSTNTLTISNTGSTINNLNDIQNVNISSVANGQTLVYNSTSGKWENGAGGTGSITFSGSTIDSDDSSQIVFTPSSKFSSDVIVENDVVVANKISAAEFVNTSTGTPTFDSASTITLKAPDGVIIQGTLNTHTIPSGTGTLALTSDIVPIVSLSSIGTGIASGDLLKVVDDPTGDAIEKKITIQSLFDNIPSPLSATFKKVPDLINQAGTAASGTVAFNTATARTQYILGLISDITINFTNVPTTNDLSHTFTVIIEQGVGASTITAIQIDGVAQTLEWEGGSGPTGTSNGIDVFTFTLYRHSSAWKALGSGKSYT